MLGDGVLKKISLGEGGRGTLEEVMSQMNW